MSRRAIFGFLGGAIVASGVWSLAATGPSAEVPAPSQAAAFALDPHLASRAAPLPSRIPDLTFTALDGREGRLSDFASAAALVLVVRDTGCPVSGRYGPRVARMERELAPRGVRFVYLNTGAHESREAMLEEVEAHGFSGPYVHDPEGVFGRALQVRATTEVFVLNGALELMYRGAVDDQYGISFTRPRVREPWLDRAIEATLAGGLPEVRETEVPGCILRFDGPSGPGSTAHAAHDGRPEPSPVRGAALVANRVAGATLLPAGGFERAGLSESPPRPAAAGASAVFANPTPTPAAATDELTYHGQISRILEKNCVSCHRAGGIAPFALDSYQNVRAFQHMIELVVRERIMPPWYANPEYGEWSNDRSVPEEERLALYQWIAEGAPEGSPADAPPPVKYADGWNIGEPDAVFELPRAFTIPAEGVVPYQYVLVETNFPEDRWIQRLEIRPTAPEVTHHVLVFVHDPNARPDGGVQGFFAATAPGSVGVNFGDGLAKLLPAGATLRFQLHYTPNGREVMDQSKIGFVFADQPPRVQVETRSAFNVTFRIPPHAERHEVVGEHRFREDGDILAFFPHTHVRGVAFRYELVKPDGSVEILLDIPKYNFDWQLTYDAAKPIPVQAGSVLRARAWYDNSANNPYNPDPEATVGFGEQTWEEMMLGYFDFVKRVP